MKVSKRSWHYRYYRRLRNAFEDGNFRGPMQDYTPYSLCSYFWTTVLMTVTAPLVAVLLVAAGIIVAVLSPVWYPIYRRKRTMKARWDAYNYGDGPRPTTNFFGLSTDKPPKDKDSLILTWIRAYKDKHCPLITLTD